MDENLKTDASVVEEKQGASLTPKEFAMLQANIRRGIKEEYSGSSMREIYDYWKRSKKNLLEMVNEINEKKSPLSATTRRMLVEEWEEKRLPFVSVATMVPSGEVGMESAEEVPTADVLEK